MLYSDKPLPLLASFSSVSMPGIQLHTLLVARSDKPKTNFVAKSNLHVCMKFEYRVKIPCYKSYPTTGFRSCIHRKSCII